MIFWLTRDQMSQFLNYQLVNIYFTFYIFQFFQIFMFILRGLDQHLPLESGSQIFPQLSLYTPPTLQFEAFIKPLTHLSTYASGIFLPLQLETFSSISL